MADTCPSDDQRLHEEHESSKDMAITPIEREHKGHRTVLKANYKESNRRLIAFLSKRKGQRKEIKGEEE
ncbi:hypothetical protein [Alkalibacterium subtropicum]|uniref:hypothetical protein n=1 Tax=Alkalibacterium subtropicum TaxID=753702 RepID=UPI001160589F|nr:hypothetical protein [Alkalibacterium subtropicum]